MNMTDRALARDAQLPTLRRRTTASLRRFWRAYWDLQAGRATVVIQYALSDRALANIGVDRSDIESALKL